MVVRAQASPARARNLRRVRAGTGVGARDRPRRLLCRGLLLRKRDASFLGGGVSQSAGESDYRHSAERATRADAVIRIGGGAGELHLPDVAAEAQEIRWPGLRRVHVHLRSGAVLSGVYSRRSGARVGFRRGNDRDAVGCDWAGSGWWSDLVAAAGREETDGTAGRGGAVGEARTEGPRP